MKKELLLTLFSFFFLGAPGAGASPAVAPSKTIVVRQTNTFFGPVTLYVGNKGLKFCEDAGEFEIVCAPPTWKVVVFRNDSHEGLERPLSEWAEHGLGILNPKMSLSDAKTTEGLDSKLKIPCRIFTVERRSRIWGMNDPLIFQHSNRQNINKQRFSCTKTFNISPQAMQFLRGLYSVKNLTPPGIPLELSYIGTDGSINHEYSTVSIQEKETKADAFAYPTSFKKVESTVQLLLAGKRKQQLKDFADTLMESVMEEHKEK